MIHFVAAAIAAQKLLERECPICRRRQPVALPEQHSTVACKYCGAEIAPKQQHDQRRPS